MSVFTANGHVRVMGVMPSGEPAFMPWAKMVSAREYAARGQKALALRELYNSASDEVQETVRRFLLDGWEGTWEELWECANELA